MTVPDKFDKLRKLGRKYFDERKVVEELAAKAQTAIGELQDARVVEEDALHHYLNELERLAQVQ